MYLKPSQKINLLCRMAGNIASKGEDVDVAVEKALRIYEMIEDKVMYSKEEGEDDNSDVE